MSLENAFVDNDNLFWLRNATVARSGDVVDAGVGTLTSILDDAGDVITGVTFPLTLVLDDATAGHWVTQIPYTAALEAGRVYTAVSNLQDDGTSARAHFETPFVAITRTST